MKPIYSSKNTILIIALIPIFLGCVFFSTIKEENPQKQFEKRQVFKPKVYNWKLRQNPPPPKLSNVKQMDKVYVMVLDNEYKAASHQCIMKRQWMDPFLEHPQIDGVEVYSTNAWTNSECNLSSITIEEMPEQKINPSAFLLYHSLKLFLDRSDAAWLFLIGDAAYIKIDRFFSWLETTTRSHNALTETFLIGSCVEERYFFQMLLTSSGILLSRNYVKRLVESRSDELWDVSFKVGITSEEILSKISDKLTVYIPGKQTHELVGRGFTHKKHYQMLMDKTFDDLPKCNIPFEYLRPAAGELGLCSAQVFKFDDMSVWSGLRHLTKKKFLETAEQMMTGNPPDLGYYWDRLYLTLCRI